MDTTQPVASSMLEPLRVELERRVARDLPARKRQQDHAAQDEKLLPSGAGKKRFIQAKHGPV